jgi:hypothetical protein
MEPEKHTEDLSNKNSSAVQTDEANSFINGTHFGRIDAIKATDVVSRRRHDQANLELKARLSKWPSKTDRWKRFSFVHTQ